MNFKNRYKNNIMSNIMDREIMTTISDNIDNIYVENNNAQINDLVNDNNFLFKEIADNVLGSKSSKINFDSDCVSFDISVDNVEDKNDKDNPFCIIQINKRNINDILIEDFIDDQNNNNQNNNKVCNNLDNINR